MTVRTTVRRRSFGAVVAAVSAVIVLSGCAAGQDATTAYQKSVVDGSSADIGSIALRNVGIAPPGTVAGYQSGQHAEIEASIVNNGINADELTSVTTTAASGAQVEASQPTSAASTDSAGASSSSSTGTPITIGANALVRIGADSGPTVTLTGLKSDLIPGQVISVTFTFASAGSVTFDIPVKLIIDSTGGESADIQPTGEG